jgi:hypothetical protein
MHLNYVAGTTDGSWEDAEQGERDAWLAEAQHIVGLIEPFQLPTEVSEAIASAVLDGRDAFDGRTRRVLTAVASGALTGDDGVAIVAALSASDPLHEWACPSCGATTRARMADRADPPLSLDKMQILEQMPDATLGRGLGLFGLSLIEGLVQYEPELLKIGIALTLEAGERLER